MQMCRFNNLDAIRLLLASTVVVGHASHHFIFHSDQFRYILAVNAFLGLSGYLVLASRESSVNALHFFWKRFLRIYPVMVLVVLVAARIAHTSVLEPLGFIFSAGITKNRAPVGPAWTIMVEECLYVVLALCFALCSLGADGETRNRRMKAVSWSLGAVSLFLPELLYRMSSNPAVFAAGRIAVLPLSFFVGNLIYLYRDSWTWVKDLRWPFFLLGLFAMWRPVEWSFPLLPWALLVAMFFRPKLWIPLLISAIVVAGLEEFKYFTLSMAELNALFLVPGCLGVGLGAKAVFGRLHDRLGDLSYGIYMIHDIVFAIATILGLGGATGFFFMWLFSYPLGYLSWHILEKRALALKNVWWNRPAPQIESR